MEQLNNEHEEQFRQDPVKQIDNLKVLEDDYWYQIKNRLRRLEYRNVPMLSTILRNQVRTNGLLYKVNHDLRREMHDVKRARRALKFDDEPSKQTTEEPKLTTIDESKGVCEEPIERKPLAEVNGRMLHE